MKVRISENGEIILSIKEMANFAKENLRRTMFFDLCETPVQSTRLPFKMTSRMISDGEVFILEGEADGISESNGELYVTLIKKVKKLRQSTVPSSEPRFIAEGCLAAFLAAEKERRERIFLILTFEDENGVSRSFSRLFEPEFLLKAASALLERCSPFAKVIKNFSTGGINDIKKMPFPYTAVREGQLDLINSVYRTIKRKERLLAVAPTGIGKTMSVLYPAVRSIGEGRINKIFYLTAKTVTGRTALEAVRRMNAFVPSLRAVMIVAKERLCPAKDKKNTFIVDRCDRMCPRLCSNMRGEYSERQNNALKELLYGFNVYDGDEIKKIAEKYEVCPYELSLDLSEYCQTVVCDYNYAFDTTVRFRRYFEDLDSSLKYVFLIDEAHNLPDRAREMYLGDISLSVLCAAEEKLKEIKYFDASIYEKIDKAKKIFDKIRDRCMEEAEFAEAETYGCATESSVPDGVKTVFKELSSALFFASRNIDDDETLKILEKLSEGLSGVLHSALFFDEKFICFEESRGNDVRLRLMCLDPSDILNGMMKEAVATVLFSATLTPTDYFADITGCGEADVLELDSPYDSDNLCCAVVDSVSTKFSSREHTVLSVAEIILTVISAKKGNYMVYFPSYSYMNDVVDVFLKMAPDNISAAVQKKGMSGGARKKFLSFFENNRSGKTLVGFCVLGGIFSEGIDLPDKMLIGVVLVGIGLPGLSSENNILREYYDRTREDGYRFAYVYPGIIKVLQAVGRVIRGENDRGVAVLIDDRYADRDIQALLPSHLKNLSFIGNTYSLERHLEKFWKDKQ